MNDINDQLNDLNASDLGDRDNDGTTSSFKEGDAVRTITGSRGEVVSVDLDPETSSNKITVKITEGEDTGEVIEVPEANLQHVS